MKNSPVIFTFLLFFFQGIHAQPDPDFTSCDSLAYLRIPDRHQDALSGSDFVVQVAGMCLEDREAAAVREILSGNVPSFSRRLKALKISQSIDAKVFELVYYATCDYLAIGSDEDYLYMPLTPSTAQYLADTLLCSLPTSRIVDHIYLNSELKLFPQPIPPSDAMTTVKVFRQHMDSINHQISHLGIDRSESRIAAGHKKDIIISNKIYDPAKPGERVVIYGWHMGDGSPIQPAYNGHIARYVDYSHGLRFISRIAYVNHEAVNVKELLKDPRLSILLSNEGVIKRPYYPQSKQFKQGENVP